MCLTSKITEASLHFQENFSSLQATPKLSSSCKQPPFDCSYFHQLTVWWAGLSWAFLLMFWPVVTHSYSYLGLDGPRWPHLHVSGLSWMAECSLSMWCLSSHVFSYSRRLNCTYLQNEGLRIPRVHILLVKASIRTIRDSTGKTPDPASVGGADKKVTF